MLGVVSCKCFSACYINVEVVIRSYARDDIDVLDQDNSKPMSPMVLFDASDI